jgi:FtsP/CotA-like multicopper oxidase with cupredoxin domain
VDPADGKPVNYYTVTEKAEMASILPRLKTPILGYNGIFPGPTISLDQGTKAVVRVRNKLPATHPERWPRARHVHPPARVSLAATVRRVRQ